VLGEKSVKTMRGEKMEDVIFAGTSSRKPANFAQVSLTFDNRLRLLKIDTDDVKVGRRLYRDGQSQYFINDSRVALKEIEDLFRDTGIGKSSYSFMETGPYGPDSVEQARRPSPYFRRGSRCFTLQGAARRRREEPREHAA
jgi:chromosome segregation protein